MKELRALQSSSCFVAGNVFYWILFSSTAPGSDAANVVFIVGTTGTFILAATVHAATSGALSIMGHRSLLESSFGALSTARRVTLWTKGLYLGLNLES